MSRSYKKAIIKDRPRNYKKSSKYWRTVRRCQKQAVNAFKDIPEPKTIVNDYDYSDYKFDYEYSSPNFTFREGNQIKNDKYATKARRK